MGRIFRRTRRDVPADVVERMEIFGRIEYAWKYRVGTSRISDLCVSPFTEDGDADPEESSDDLLAHFNGYRSEFAIHGAARLGWEVCRHDDLWRAIPSASALIDTGMDHEVARGGSHSTPPPCEATRLDQRRAAGDPL